MDRRAFTLIELVVVISFLSLLAALLFPVVVTARAAARRSSCAANLKQIACAGQMYAENYDGRLPSCYRLPTFPNIFDSSMALQPYLRNWEVLYCPDRHTVLFDCLDPRNGNRPNSRCMGYGYNWGSGSGWSGAYSKQDGLVRPAPGNTRAVIGVLLSEVVEPSRCLFFGDTNDSVFLTLLRDVMPGVRRGDSPDAATNDLNLPYEPPRHGRGNNFAFVDGHVQWLRFPGGRWIDGGAWVVPDMAMYSRTGKWEATLVP